MVAEGGSGANGPASSSDYVDPIEVGWAALTTAVLGARAKLWGLDTVVVLRTLLLNGIAGVVFGWLYWKRGLEMAMLSHFSADIVLHVIAPLLSPGASP